MANYLTLTALGIFAHDESGKIRYHSLFYPDVNLAISVLNSVTCGKMPPLLRDFVNLLIENGIKEIVVENDKLRRILIELEDILVVFKEISPPLKMFRAMLDTILVDNGFVTSSKECTNFKRKVAIEIAWQKVKDASKSPDARIKNAIDTIDELDRFINKLTMRLREWLALYSPKLSKLLSEQENAIYLIQNLLKTRTVMKELVENDESLLITEQFIQEYKIIHTFLDKNDTSALLCLIQALQEQIETRKLLESYVNHLMNKFAPNLTMLAGPLVGARLISAAGSLKELARKPASTIQVLGAEKALFRSLKTGAPPPKHGIIFQVPLLHSSPYWQRGKIARALSGKLIIAARVDAYSRRQIAFFLKEALAKRIAEIKHQYPTPPTSKDKKPKGKRDGKGKQRLNRRFVR